jgi:hypothetical protein
MFGHRSTSPRPELRARPCLPGSVIALVMIYRRMLVHVPVHGMQGCLEKQMLESLLKPRMSPGADLHPALALCTHRRWVQAKFIERDAQPAPVFSSPTGKSRMSEAAGRVCAGEKTWP